MQIGALRHRLILEKPAYTQVPSGEAVLGFDTGHTVWASIEPLRGRDQAIFGGQDSQTDTRIRFRWSPALAAMDATWRGRVLGPGGEKVYNFQSVADVELRHAEFEIMASSGLNRG